MRPENVRLLHIAKAMKVSVKEITDLSNNPRWLFLKARRRPIGAKTRLITPPKFKWKKQIRWLALFVREELPLHHAAHGSVSGKSPFTAASKHLGWRHLLCHDVKDAFPNIRSDRFYLEMLAVGLSCEVASIITKLLLPDGYIPQGGPASNAAMDLFFYRADGKLEQEFYLIGGRYTRFTDGLDVSFAAEEHRLEIERAVMGQLDRLGLSVNPIKFALNGWNHASQERIICGVCVNSAAGTNLPRATLGNVINACESLHRGVLSATPRTLQGLARRRRSVQGWLNQLSQADLAPVGDLQRRLNQVDGIVQRVLRKFAVCPHRRWYTKGRDFDTARELGEVWAFRLKYLATLAA